LPDEVTGPTALRPISPPSARRAEVAALNEATPPAKAKIPKAPPFRIESEPVAAVAGL